MLLVLHFAVKKKSACTKGSNFMRVRLTKNEVLSSELSVLFVTLTYTLFHRAFEELQQLQISLSWIRVELRFYLAIFYLKIIINIAITHIHIHDSLRP